MPIYMNKGRAVCKKYIFILKTEILRNFLKNSKKLA